MTHSVANCLKRVVVIVSAVVFFQHPVSLPNAVGTSVALAGVFLFSQARSGAGHPVARHTRLLCCTSSKADVFCGDADARAAALLRGGTDRTTQAVTLPRR